MKNAETLRNINAVSEVLTFGSTLCFYMKMFSGEFVKMETSPISPRISLMFKELRDYTREFAAYNLLLEDDTTQLVINHDLDTMVTVSLHISIMIQYINPEFSESLTAPDGVEFFPKTPE